MSLKSLVHSSLIHMNDIHKCSDMFDFHLFADESSLLYADKSLTSLEAVNNELKNIANWLNANKLTRSTNNQTSSPFVHTERIQMEKGIYLQSHETAMGTRFCKSIQDESRNKCFSQNPSYKLWNATEEHRKSIGWRIYSWEQRWENGQDTSMEFTQGFHSNFAHKRLFPALYFASAAVLTNFCRSVENFCHFILKLLPLHSNVSAVKNVIFLGFETLLD